MVQSNMKQKYLHLPELESINRISNLPIVESGWIYAGQIYNRVKLSNNLFQWTFDQAENSIYNVIDTASPAFILLEAPLNKIDKILCKSLDIVEQTVPAINLPPQMIYSNTKEYVTGVGNKIVRPVLKRADSVKQIGNTVLGNKYTAFAADKLDGALDVADRYVDKYLPVDECDGVCNEESTIAVADGPAGKAIRTSQHMYRLSQKLQRRITRRTLLEAKALKEHSTEAIHVLVYVAELVATDPKLAFQKGQELWHSLSKDEPENQARPENLEQLVVLLTREAARRVVHLINFTAYSIGKVPKRITAVLHTVTSTCLQILDNLLKSVHLEHASDGAQTLAQSAAYTLTLVLKELNLRFSEFLDQLAENLAIRNQLAHNPSPPPAVKSSKPKRELQQETQAQTSKQDTLRPPVQNKPQLKATHRPMNSVSNGETTTNKS